MQEQHEEARGQRQQSEPPIALSLAVLLALAGSRRTSAEALRRKARLQPLAFENLLNWLQRRRLVVVSTSLEGEGVTESVAMTEDGEAFLLGLLEKTCEIPELR